MVSGQAASLGPAIFLISIFLLRGEKLPGGVCFSYFGLLYEPGRCFLRDNVRVLGQGYYPVPAPEEINSARVRKDLIKTFGEFPASLEGQE